MENDMNIGLNLDDKHCLWDTVYNWIESSYKRYDISNDVKQIISNDKTRVRQIIDPVRGNWWKAAHPLLKLWCVSHSSILDPFGRLWYEFGREDIVSKIVLRDLSLLKTFVKEKG